jgi:hypothetical protein
MAPSSLQEREGFGRDLRKLAAQGLLWAILDACDEPAVLSRVVELGPERVVSLYRGRAEQEQRAIAPYVTKVDEALLDWIITTLWKKPWGVFAVAECDLQTLRKHFRRFLIVEDPESQTMYFRYYDPRVLAVFLPTCTREELKTFLGPLTAFAVGDPESDGVKFFLNVPD